MSSIIHHHHRRPPPSHDQAKIMDPTEGVIYRAGFLRDLLTPPPPPHPSGEPCTQTNPCMFNYLHVIVGLQPKHQLNVRDEKQMTLEPEAAAGVNPDQG